MPKRIQRSRAKGWRKPDSAVYVGRNTKWGNPFTFGKTQVRMPAIFSSEAWEIEGRCGKRSGERHIFTYSDKPSTWHFVEDATREQVVELYREYVTGTGNHLRGSLWYGSESYVEQIRRELAGKDLMCWCPLDMPCHADVLLEIANGEEQ